MCKFNFSCVGTWQPKHPNATCLDCLDRKAKQGERPKKPMEMPAEYTPCYKRNYNKVPRSLAKIEARQARIIEIAPRSKAEA